MVNPPPSGPSVVGLPGVENLLKLGMQNTGGIIKAIVTQFPAQSPTQSALSIAYSSKGGTTISQKTVGGYLMAVAVTTPSTGIGYIYDTNSPANVGASLIMAAIPASTSPTTYTFGFPYFTGLTVQPSSIDGGTVSAYFI